MVLESYMLIKLVQAWKDDQLSRDLGAWAVFEELGPKMEPEQVK